MTDPTPVTPLADPSRDPGLDPDLVTVVQLADAYGIEQPIVLTLAGLVLEGTLTSGRAYFAGLAESVQADDPDGTLRADLAQSFRRRAEDFDQFGTGSALGRIDRDGPEDTDLPPMPPVAFLHLRDVCVVTSPVSGQRLDRWRGRISQVVGWTVGAFEDVPPPR
jgi:hypothetical protein